MGFTTLVALSLLLIVSKTLSAPEDRVQECIDKYASGLSDPDIDQPWKAVGQARFICEKMTKQSYTDYVDCKPNAFRMAGFGEWYDNMCHNDNDLDCVQEVVSGQHFQYFMEKDYAIPLNYWKSEITNFNESCQLQHEQNLCIVNLIRETCDAQTADNILKNPWAPSEYTCGDTLMYHRYKNVNC